MKGHSEAINVLIQAGSDIAVQDKVSKIIFIDALVMTTVFGRLTLHIWWYEDNMTTCKLNVLVLMSISNKFNLRIY